MSIPNLLLSVGLFFFVDGFLYLNYSVWNFPTPVWFTTLPGSGFILMHRHFSRK